MGFCALVGDIADACASPKWAPDLHQGRTAAHTWMKHASWLSARDTSAACYRSETCALRVERSQEGLENGLDLPEFSMKTGFPQCFRGLDHASNLRVGGSRSGLRPRSAIRRSRIANPSRRAIAFKHLRRASDRPLFHRALSCVRASARSSRKPASQSTNRKTRETL
jgi:hypothetical protein